MSLPTTVLDRQLFDAAIGGDHDAVVTLLKLGASHTATHDPYECTALHAAAKLGHTQVVQELLQHGAQPAARAIHGITPLHLAAQQGHSDVAAALLAGGAPVDTEDKFGATPLHAAADGGHLALMDLLVEAGARQDAPDSRERTPLHHAASAGQHQAAWLLLTSGAAVGATCNEGLQPLHCAAQAGHVEVATVLLRAKASLTALTNSGRTPLYLASAAGREKMVRLLLSSGADPYTPAADGWLPLHMACEGNHVGVVTCLLRGRRVPAHVNALGAHDLTPLHLAASNGHVKVASLLVKAGADVDARSASQRTPLHQAVIGGHSLVLEQLLAAGADPGALTATGALGLHLAAMRGHTTILQQLLAAMAAREGGGGVDAPYAGMTALHWAVETGHTNCMEVLLAAGADPDKLYAAEAVDGQGHSLEGASALHRAVGVRRTAAVPLLITPANMAHVYKSYTPLHWALMLTVPCPEIVQALVAAGSPAGVASSTGATAMSLAAVSKDAGYQALLPAMVRRECEVYKQLQQGVSGQQQQQQGAGAGLAAVTDALFTYLRATSTDSTADSSGHELACFQVVMEVLGPAVGGSLLQQVVGKVRGISLIVANRSSTALRLCMALHAGWLAALKPLMCQRRRLSNRFQRLVSSHPVQQLQQQPQQRRKRKQRLPWCKAPRSAAWASTQSVGLKGQVAAAAAAGQWRLFVQLLDQLTGLHKPSASYVMKQLQQQQVVQGATGLLGLCEALLGAWQAAVVGLAGRMQRELVDAVVRAVQAARQPQPQHAVVEGGVQKRRRTGGSQGRT